MTFVEAMLVLLAGVGAGTINAVVGSGTLITFPTLLAFGIPPVTRDDEQRGRVWSPAASPEPGDTGASCAGSGRG